MDAVVIDLDLGRDGRLHALAAIRGQQEPRLGVRGDWTSWPSSRTGPTSRSDTTAMDSSGSNRVAPGTGAASPTGGAAHGPRRTHRAGEPNRPHTRPRVAPVRPLPEEGSREWSSRRLLETVLMNVAMLSPQKLSCQSGRHDRRERDGHKRSCESAVVGRCEGLCLLRNASAGVVRVVRRTRATSGRIDAINAVLADRASRPSRTTG